jgi:hypothetical protein
MVKEILWHTQPKIKNEKTKAKHLRLAQLAKTQWPVVKWALASKA